MKVSYPPIDLTDIYTATMRLDGTPNDIVQNLDPIVLIIFIPIVSRLLTLPRASTSGLKPHLSVLEANLLVRSSADK